MTTGVGTGDTSNEVAGYVVRMLATLGVVASEHASRVDEIIALPQAERNQAIAALVSEVKAKRLELSSDAQHLLKTFSTAENTQEYRTAKNDLDTALNQAEHYATEVQKRLASAATHRAAIAKLRGESMRDMLGVVQEVCADGWYQFNLERTRAVNGTNSPIKTLVFTTVPVVVTWLNISRGVNQAKNFGQYEVRYTPGEAALAVYKYKDNLTAMNGTTYSEYCHPHISRQGQPCWGNGQSTVTQSLIEWKPLAAFQVLKSLLLTYNEHGPYESFENFAGAVIDSAVPEADYREAGMAVMILENIPLGAISAVEYVHDNDEGLEIGDIMVYQEHVTGDYALKVGTSYVRISASHIMEWL